MKFHRHLFGFYLGISLLGSPLTAQQQPTGITYAVGTCRPSFPSYPTISAALVATPPPTVVLVCPGTYQEQVVITQSVTLQGISSGNSDQAVIVPPSGGLTANASDDFGNSLAVQLWVNNAPGPVNISNMTLDGSGSGLTTCPPSIIGIFYQNSPGTVNRVALRNQKDNGCDSGILLEGGGTNPSVTVENSSIHDFGSFGIHAETNSVSSELTATIKNNSVSLGKPTLGIDIFLEQGITATVTGNFVVGGNQGIFFFPGSAGSASGNTLMSLLAYAVLADSDGVSAVKNNKVFDAGGIFVGTTVAAIQGNTITSGFVGIEFGCTVNNNVNSNSITDAGIGVDQVPAGVVTTNAYVNVGTIKAGC